MTDPLSPLAVALDGAGTVIAGISGDRWTAPSPCSEWTVRQVANHLVFGNRLTADVLAAGALPPMDELRRRAQEDQLGDDAAAAFRASADALLAAFARPGALEGVHPLPVGALPGAAAVHLRAVETLVHGWDLAVATGQELPAPAALAEAELGFSRDLLGRIPEGRRPFGPPRPVADDAPALDRLVALLGRDPAWAHSGGRSS